MVLTIGDKQITHISGPILMEILVPSKEFMSDLWNNDKVYAPIFMLFGDVHNSTEFLCQVFDENKLDILEIPKILDTSYGEKLFKIDVTTEGYNCYIKC